MRRRRGWWWMVGEVRDRGGTGIQYSRKAKLARCDGEKVPLSLPVPVSLPVTAFLLAEAWPFFTSRSMDGEGCV